MNETSQSPVIDNDEIDLFELVEQLWFDKSFIILITAVIFILSALYAFTVSPTYKTEAFFLPPLEQDIATLNKATLATTGGNKFKQYRPDEVYQSFLTNIESRSLRLAFFKQNKALLNFYRKQSPSKSDSTIFEKQFNKNLKLIKPKKKNKSPFVRLSFEIKNQTLSAEALNAFITFAANETQRETLGEITFEIDNNLSTLKTQIKSKRALAEQRRKDRVIKLEENLIIAKAMSIDNSQISQAANNLNMEYMRGIASIDAEIKLLKQRKNDDPFIEGIRTLQEQETFLQGLSFSTDQIKTFRLDQPAIPPEQPIKPKKHLILAIGLILGGMLGIFASLIRSAIRKRTLQTAGQN